MFGTAMQQDRGSFQASSLLRLPQDEEGTDGI